MHFLTLLSGLIWLNCGSNALRRRFTRSDDSDWSYSGENGPEHWLGVCQSGIRQSPVDIGGPRKKLDGQSLHFDGAYNKATSWYASWNGHSYAATFKKKSDVAILQGGLLEDDFIFQSLHVHFEAEHTIEDERYDGEMHLVHFNAKYSANDAPYQADGVAVIGIFLEEEKDLENSTMSDFLELMTDDERPDNKPIKKFSLKSLFPQETEAWVRYKGSLTTPPCSESVIWTVFLEPVNIRKGLVKEIRKKYGESFRPTQPIHNRTIYEHKSKIPERDTSNEVINSAKKQSIVLALFISSLIGTRL